MMAFTELERRQAEQQLESFLECRRPPPQIRSKVDLGYRIKRQSVEIFEIRPSFDDSTRLRESAIAKATYVRTHDHWKVFWLHQDLRWHGYEPMPEVPNLKHFLDIVDADEYGCFFG